MLTKTTEVAIQAMLYLVFKQKNAPIAPREIAGHLGASPSYMAKITGQMVKADLMRAHRGVHGGVSLARSPEQITLLHIVEACQGKILADYCECCDNLDIVCAFHHAMAEVHLSLTGILSKWTLADLAHRPAPSPHLRGKVSCRLSKLHNISPSHS